MDVLQYLFLYIYGISTVIFVFFIIGKYYTKKMKLLQNNMLEQKGIIVMTKGTVLKKIPENGEGEVLFKKLGNTIRKKAINLGNTPVLPGTEVFVLEEKNDRLVIFPRFSY